MGAAFVNPLPGVPSVESPFFERLFEGVDPGTRRIAADLHHQGYAVIDFPEPEFDRIAEEIKRDLHHRYDWDGWRAGKVSSLDLRVADGWKFDANVRRIAANQKILALLEALYGRKAFPFQSLNFGVGSQQHLHTDSVHFSSSPERFMCGVWVALEDIDEKNGPLVYCPGSHAWPVYTNEHVGVNAAFLRSTYEAYPKFEAMWDALVESRGGKLERFFARKGQALIWAANLLHGGDKQLDGSRTRWSQVTHYYFDGCSYYTPLMSDVFYGHAYFREPLDLISGATVKNSVAGHRVPDDFIRRTAPKDSPLARRPVVQRVRRLLGRVRRRLVR